MRAFIIILTLLLTSTAHAQSACRQYEQELQRAKTLHYPSGRAAAAEAASLTTLQNACRTELVEASPLCHWVLSQAVQIMENDKRVTVAAACASALERERMGTARADGQLSKAIK
jgi:hypothetical protein